MESFGAFQEPSRHSGFTIHPYGQKIKLHIAYDSCGSPPGVMMADTLSFNAKIGVVDF